MTATTVDTALRVAPGPDSVQIWSQQIFGGAEPHTLREFLTRAFSVEEVEGVELQPTAAFGRLRYRKRSSPAAVWKKLSRALRGVHLGSNGSNGSHAASKTPTEVLEVGAVYLDGPDGNAVQITRIGAALTTWHVKKRGERSLQLFHPRLRGNRDLHFRLEEELAATYGVLGYSASTLTGTVSISFDTRLLSDARLAVLLEKAWPRLLDGLSAPPAPRRFAAAGGVLGLAFTGQFLVPALRPVAVLAAAAYSSPNALGAARDLKRGSIGLPALYTTGLAFMLYTGMPFTAGLFAVLSQLWPNLATRKLVRSQRRLFAEQRRRPAWVRLQRSDSAEVEVHVDDVQRDDLVLVQRGETVPVDGVVVQGLAAVVSPAAFGRSIRDLSQGDSVLAGSVLRDGTLTVRVERAGAATLSSVLDAWLPHAGILDMPSALEAERIANRNARPALALSLANLFFTRTLRVSQALIRPDYATAPRLSVQLSGLHALAEGFAQGVVFKRPAALDHLASAEVFVIDDSAEIDRPLLSVSGVETTSGMTKELLLQYALTAQQHAGTEQSRALVQAAQGPAVQAQTTLVARFAGVSRYRDTVGRAIEVASDAYLAANKVHVPKRFAQSAEQGPLRPMYVLRDGELIGRVLFARRGEAQGVSLVAAIKAHAPRARIVYASSAKDADAQAIAASVGIETVYAGLTAAQKVQLIRDTPRAAVWIGDGTREAAREPIQASAVSVSLAQQLGAQEDAADVLLGDGSVAHFASALAAARAHAARLTRDYRTVYSVNLLGAAGAVVARVTSLQAGLLSNAGTLAVYVRQARALDELAATAEATRQRLTRALHP
jgi:cation transport ATPase